MSCHDYSLQALHEYDAERNDIPTRRCPLCRRDISGSEEVMYADGYGREVILHERCALRQDHTFADMLEILGLTASYCSLAELESMK